MILTMDHTQVDKDFFIKVQGLLGYGKKTTLLSSRKMEKELGEQLYDKTIDRVYTNGQDGYVAKFRRGLKVWFYLK